MHAKIVLKNYVGILRAFMGGRPSKTEILEDWSEGTKKFPVRGDNFSQNIYFIKLGRKNM